MKSGTSLSIFYFIYLGFIVIPFSFYPLRLQDIGFSAGEIGFISTVSNLAVLIGAVFALQLAHKLQSERMLGLLLGLSCVLLLIPIIYIESFLVILIAMALSSLTHKGCGALIDARLVRNSEQGGVAFEKVRLWGSIGFLICSFIVGILVDIYGTWIILPTGIIIGIPIPFFMAYLFGKKPAKQAVSTPPENESINDEKYSLKLWLLPFSILLLSALLGMGSAGPMVVYLSVYLQSLGWSGTLISTAWGFAVTAEIIFFIFFVKIQKNSPF